jgi:uncharacterized protein
VSEIELILSVLFILIIIQTIVGVGILVIGTPFLLILGFNIMEIFSILLPISILTSFINLLFFKLKKKELKMKINSETKYLFFFICLPSIFIGLYLLDIFYELINFKYLVSLIIILSVLFIKIKKEKIIINNGIKTFYLILIGIVHGLTNSGGSLLSLFMSSHLKKNNSRYGVTFFYFFLALFQFLIFNILFEFNLNIINFYFIGIFLPIGVIIGNYFVKHINEDKFKNLINILCLITCFVLITSST